MFWTAVRSLVYSRVSASWEKFRRVHIIFLDERNFPTFFGFYMKNYEHGTVPMKFFGELALETYTFAKEYNEHGTSVELFLSAHEKLLISLNFSTNFHRNF